jgi:hypothetical protein
MVSTLTYSVAEPVEQPVEPEAHKAQVVHLPEQPVLQAEQAEPVLMLVLLAQMELLAMVEMM